VIQQRRPHRPPRLSLAATFAALLFPLLPALAQQPTHLTGFANPAAEAKWDAAFMAVPDPKLAGEELKILTAAPHWASSPEDKQTADYVAAKFKAAGLDTQIVPFRVWLNKPIKIEITAFDASGKQLMSGPSPEHVDPNAYGGDPFQNDPRILPAFNSSSPSGDVTADVVYANYGTLADFDRLQQLGVSVKGKIVLVRYGQNFRGVKVYIAQQRGAAGVLIYSDPADDGYDRGDKYPRGPYRPDSGVQRGSVQFLPIYPGDPETPGIASTPDLPDSRRITDPAKMNQPSIPSNPLSYKDAAPILAALDGPTVPHEWQGGLPFAYHLGGTGAVKVHMHLEQDYQLRTIWDVIGTIDGTNPAEREDWVVAGNHRDAWVFGAVDPNSGTAAMLEAVHGLGELLKQGWHPKRRIVVCSWDAEEEGLMGSTEWAEGHENHLNRAVAYFNTDVGVSGPDFNASAVPSLKEFVRDVARQVPSPKGGTVYEQWLRSQNENLRRRRETASPYLEPSTSTAITARVGDLGSGSDFTPFIQHLGVPSTDIGSDGPYGVYHSAFDDFNWFTKFADPTFVYEQQQARVFGLEILHMADADILPYDYDTYGKEIVGYLRTAQQRAAAAHLDVDFTAANAAAARFAAAGRAVSQFQTSALSSSESVRASLNRALRDAEEDLLNQAGLPHRPWYRHTIYAPGEYTGYSAVVIPGVNEGIDAQDAARTSAQLATLTDALNRSANTLETAAHRLP
jgi:N-acetylated-alpha-linked acidic dipeptidase